MNTRWTLTISLVLLATAPTFAQTPWQYSWKKGDSLIYKVKHVTNVSEVVETKKAESSSNLELVKRWDVTDVDNEGIATLELTLTAMRHEQKRANGAALLFDSNDAEKSAPELREQMSKFINKPLAILRMDRYGRVHETKLGSAARYEAEPPFVVIFPAAKAEAGQAWRRQYVIVMEPPLGTGEKYDAEQIYGCKSITDGKAVLTVTTRFKTTSENVIDRLPLLQKDMQGEVVFDLQAGRTRSISLNIDKTVENHQGKGSSYRFQSQYSEALTE